MSRPINDILSILELVLKAVCWLIDHLLIRQVVPFMLVGDARDRQRAILLAPLTRQNVDTMRILNVCHAVFRLQERGRVICIRILKYLILALRISEDLLQRGAVAFA